MQILDRAGDFQPLLRRRAREMEKARCLPPDLAHAPAR